MSLVMGHFQSCLKGLQCGFVAVSDFAGKLPFGTLYTKASGVMFYYHLMQLVAFRYSYMV